MCCSSPLNSTGTRTQYSREYLLSLRNSRASRSAGTLDLSAAPRCTIRKRGRRGGIRQRAKKRRHRLPLPSIVFGNTQSIRNKTDELEACVRYRSEYRDANMLAITESWLTENDCNPDLEGFTMVRLDRDEETSEKSKGGGVCLYINDKWCNNVTVKHKFCSGDIELLSVATRPFYLPREFNQIFTTVVYIPPDGNDNAAAYKIMEVVNSLLSESPESPCFVLGDFNTCRLNRVLPHFKQYVTCETRNTKTIDLCYGNIPGAFRSFPMASLGRSDHNMIQLVPTYLRKLKRTKPVIRTIQVWSRDAEEALNGCFHSTDWPVFFESSETLDEAVDVMSSYVNFCVDTVLDKKDIKVYGNDKPWLNGETKKVINEKMSTFKTESKEERKVTQKKLDKVIKQAKNRFADKIEENFKDNKPRKMWQGIQTITGCKPKKKQPAVTDEAKLAEELNEFYTRFDRYDFSTEQNQIIDDIEQLPHGQVKVEEAEVKLLFSKVDPRSAPGPDKVSGKVLKNCNESLAPAFCHAFNQCLEEGVVPETWKTATIVPVPKKSNPKEMNDYRPVALTSVPFKCLERIVLDRLRKETSEHQDPNQFAYKKGSSTDDAIILLIQNILSHLEKQKTYARVLFIDFSSAFNTIQPHLMLEKLMSMSVNPTLLKFIMSFLTNRKQKVRVGQTLSSEKTTNTGAPQGCVLSPVLFTLYTSDCKSEDILIKFADDTSLTGLISSDESKYRESVGKLEEWCDDNFLELNVSKTKEVVVDFRRKPSELDPVTMKGEAVERVSSYKYLGVTIDEKLNFADHVQNTSKKANQRMFFLRKLKKCKVKKDILSIFYQCSIQSVMLFNSICFFNNAKQCDKDKLERTNSLAGKIIGEEQLSLEKKNETNMKKKMTKILSDPFHPMQTFIETSKRHPSRLISCKSRTDRFRNSFLPTAIRLFNEK